MRAAGAAGYAGGVESVAVIGGGTMGGGIAGHLARAGLRVALVDASPELAEQARERLLERTRGHVDAGLLPAEATEATARVTTPPDLEAAVGDADLVIEAVPEEQALKEDVLGRMLGRRAGDGDHRLEHLLAADRGPGRRGARAGALPRRALVQPAGVDARDRGHPRRGRRAARPSTACSRFLRDDRQAPGRGRRPSGLRRQPAPDGAAARGDRDRGRGPGDAREPRRGRAHHLRLPPAVLRPVPDRGHGRARHQRERLRDARARHRPRVRGARRAARAGRRGPARHQERRGLRRVHRRGARARCCSSATAATRRSPSCSPTPVDVCDSRPAGDPHSSRQGT